MLHDASRKESRRKFQHTFCPILEHKPRIRLLNSVNVFRARALVHIQVSLARLDLVARTRLGRNALRHVERRLFLRFRLWRDAAVVGGAVWLWAVAAVVVGAMGAVEGARGAVTGGLECACAGRGVVVVPLILGLLWLIGGRVVSVVVPVALCLIVLGGVVVVVPISLWLSVLGGVVIVVVAVVVVVPISLRGAVLSVVVVPAAGVCIVSRLLVS